MLNQPQKGHNMDEYLIDRADLEQFVDELIKRRALPVASAEDLPSYREGIIKQLNDEITMAVFGKFSPEQLEDIERTIDAGNDTPEYFQSLFAKHNIDLKKTIADTAAAFGKKFIGASNE